MKVFISWSGKLSRSVAEVLREWLPFVIKEVEPYMSSKDVDKGERWSLNIASHLEDTSIGIVCLTRENLQQSWINYEAGALSKVVAGTRLNPLLIDLPTSMLTGSPLEQFQATQLSDVEDFHRLLASINSMAAEPVADKHLRAATETLIGKLKEVPTRISRQTVAPIGYGWGELVDTLVDAALFVNDKRDARTVISGCLQARERTEAKRKRQRPSLIPIGTIT